MNGPIEPWQDQNSHIPHRLFHHKKHHSQHKEEAVKKLGKTQESLSKKMRTEQSGLTFRKARKQNQQRIFTLEFNRRKQINSNLQKILCGPPREETGLVGRRSSKKGIQIGSLKKKIIDLEIKTVSPLLVYRTIEKKVDSEPRLDELLKQQVHQKIKSNDSSLLVKRAQIGLKPQRKTQTNLFFSTIASINKEKSRLPISHNSSLHEEMQVERKMFLKNNRKFRSWQTLSKTHFSLSSTHERTHRTIHIH